MCGISGIIANRKISKEEIGRMNQALSHRGPDGEGVWCFENVGLGHRRLSILDLSEAGNQPMHYLNRYVITYNGEIYNYIELKNELKEQGYAFYSDTDTEVLLAAYDHWGTDCLQKLNGMWAFVLYDKKKRTFFISRDRFGIKPLYYYSDGEQFVFASEIKAILRAGGVEKNIHGEMLKDYLENGQKEYIQETAFQHIYRFKHAHYTECDSEKLLSGNFNEKKYWNIDVNLSDEPFKQSHAEVYADRFSELFEDAVKLRLRSDVRVGSALSGGIDSSAVVLTVNKVLKEQGKTELQETFSSVYKSKEAAYCDESSYIDELARFLKVRSNQVEPDIAGFQNLYSKIIYHLDTPADGTLISPWYVYQLARKRGVTVTLDGQGADEMFAGYHSYVRQHIIHAKNPMKVIWKFNNLDLSKRLMTTSLFYNLAFKLLPAKQLDVFLNKKEGRQNLLKHLNKRLFDDTTRYLTKHLHFTDRLGMAHSVESRVPFLDYRLVEFAMQLPVAYKLHDGWTKYIVRKAFDKKIPDNVIWRKDKLGFPSPERYWFEGPLKEYIRKTINTSFILQELEPGVSYESLMNINTGLAQMIRYFNLAVWHTVYFGE